MSNLLAWHLRSAVSTNQDVVLEPISFLSVSSKFVPAHVAPTLRWPQTVWVKLEMAGGNKLYYSNDSKQYYSTLCFISDKHYAQMFWKTGRMSVISHTRCEPLVPDAVACSRFSLDLHVLVLRTQESGSRDRPMFGKWWGGRDNFLNRLGKRLQHSTRNVATYCSTIHIFLCKWIFHSGHMKTCAPFQEAAQCRCHQATKKEKGKNEKEKKIEETELAIRLLFRPLALGARSGIVDSRWGLARPALLAHTSSLNISQMGKGKMCGSFQLCTFNPQTSACAVPDSCEPSSNAQLIYDLRWYVPGQSRHLERPRPISPSLSRKRFLHSGLTMSKQHKRLERRWKLSCMKLHMPE